MLRNRAVIRVNGVAINIFSDRCDRLSPETIEAHIEAAIAFILAGVKRSD